MKEKLEAILKNGFGYPTFKTGQKETIESLLAGKDTLAILPTGTGKSVLSVCRKILKAFSIDRFTTDITDARSS